MGRLRRTGGRHNMARNATGKAILASLPSADSANMSTNKTVVTAEKAENPIDDPRLA